MWESYVLFDIQYVVLMDYFEWATRETYTRFSYKDIQRNQESPLSTIIAKVWNSFHFLGKKLDYMHLKDFLKYKYELYLK